MQQKLAGFANRKLRIQSQGKHQELNIQVIEKWDHNGISSKMLH